MRALLALCTLVALFAVATTLLVAGLVLPGAEPT